MGATNHIIITNRYLFKRNRSEHGLHKPFVLIGSLLASPRDQPARQLGPSVLTPLRLPSGGLYFLLTAISSTHLQTSKQLWICTRLLKKPALLLLQLSVLNILMPNLICTTIISSFVLPSSANCSMSLSFP